MTAYTTSAPSASSPQDSQSLEGTLLSSSNTHAEMQSAPDRLPIDEWQSIRHSLQNYLWGLPKLTDTDTEEISKFHTLVVNVKDFVRKTIKHDSQKVTSTATEAYPLLEGNLARLVDDCDWITGYANHVQDSQLGILLGGSVIDVRGTKPQLLQSNNLTDTMKKYSRDHQISVVDLYGKVSRFSTKVAGHQVIGDLILYSDGSDTVKVSKAQSAFRSPPQDAQARILSPGTPNAHVSAGVRFTFGNNNMGNQVGVNSGTITNSFGNGGFSTASNPLLQHFISFGTEGRPKATPEDFDIVLRQATTTLNSIHGQVLDLLSELEG